MAPEYIEPVSIAGGYDFSTALKWLKEGRSLTRTEWGVWKEVFVFLVPGSEFSVNREPLLSILGDGTRVLYRPHIDMRCADGSVGVWSPSMSDVLGHDWYVINPDNRFF